MEKLIKARIEYLKKKIEEYDNILKNKDNLDKETRKNIQNMKKQIAVIITLFLGTIIWLNNKSGVGNPFIKDDIKVYREVKTTIKDGGNIEKTPGEYNYSDSYVVTNPKLPESYLKSYSNWTQSVSEPYIRYIEEYSIGEKSAEEIAELLKQEDLDLENVFGDPISITKQENPTNEELQETAYIEAVTWDIDRKDSIIRKETNQENSHSISAWMMEIVDLLLASTILIRSLDSKKALEEILEKYPKKKEKWESKLKNASLKLERKKKNDNKEL